MAPEFDLWFGDLHLTPSAHVHDLVPVEHLAAGPHPHLWPVVEVVGHRCLTCPHTQPATTSTEETR